MLSAQSAIHRFRRDLTISTLLKAILIGAAVTALLAGPIFGGRIDGSILLIVVGVIWLVLSYRSVRGSRITADSPGLIASGQFEAAEQRIIEALHAFSLFRTVKMLSLHHLAMLRHAQERWQETIMLCRALLRQRLRPASGLSKSTHLILADALLEMGDVRGAYESISRLYQQRLSLGEALNLMSVQLEYSARIGAWDAMLHELPTRVQLAELLPSNSAAQVQAFLALAARKTARADWERWLKRRVELLCEVPTLTKRRPMLAELWQS